ncbi:MAG: SH3 domain-containing protein [Oscillospiraceae bacterium]|nr:SH3 domain-containing protein [Oscillospiraceae bacterium]
MDKKSVIISAVSVAGTLVVVGAFVLGMKVMEKKQSKEQSTAESIHEETVAVTESECTTVNETTESTTTTTTLATTEETTTVTTVTTAPKPTITNSYLYYINTGIGCKLYLHVDGDYTDYEYEVYLGSDKTDDGKNSKQEFLVAEGLGGGISTYKALVTAWNPDHSQSVEQWAYINENLSDDGSVHPPQTEEYLFGGYVTGVKKSLNLRRKPSADSASLAEIPDGMQLGIYRADVNGWYWTEYNGLKGYVNAKFIKEIEPYDPFTDGPGNVISYIQGGDAPLRDYPADNGSVYTFIPDGTEVVLISREGDWFMVTYDGVTGYIHKSHTGW